MFKFVRVKIIHKVYQVTPINRLLQPMKRPGNFSGTMFSIQHQSIRGAQSHRHRYLSWALLTSFVLFINFTASAQYDSYFGETSTSWKTLNTFVTLESGSLDSIAYWGQASENGFLYRIFKIYSVESSLDGEAILSDGFQESGFVWLRQSDDHAILYIDFGTESAPEGNEQMVCNMNLELGDIFMAQEVIAVGTDSEGRKQIVLESGSGQNTMLEGVGATFFFAQSEFQALLCQTKDGMTSYTIDDNSLSPYCLGIPVSSSDHASYTSSVLVYPNPAQNELKIEIDGALCEHYIISNALGIEVKYGMVNKANSSIDLSELTAGAYFLEVDCISGKVKFLKFD